MIDLLSSTQGLPPLTIWILQTGEPLHVDAGSPRPMRAMNLANSLVAAGHRVVVWSSAFSHQERRHRSRTADRIRVAERLEYRLIPSPGYRRNIGPGRLMDHALMGSNLRRLLRGEQSLPDAAFVGFPPIETAAVMTRWIRERGVPSLLDIKDQWPEIFVDGVPGALKPIGRLALAPYFTLARRAMTDADGIVAMTESYLQWALAFIGRERRETDVIAPLTSPIRPLSDAELSAARAWWAERGVTAGDGKSRVSYVGSQNRSYDFLPVASAVRELASSRPECEFVFAGTGEQSAAWQSALEGLPNVKFPGWIDQAKLRVLADLSMALIAPYRVSQGFDLNVPNKIVDAISLGRPVITPLRGDVASLIDREGIGLRYGTDSGRSLVDCVAALMQDADLQRRMSQAAARVHERQFKFEEVYARLVANLERLGRSRAGSP